MESARQLKSGIQFESEKSEKSEKSESEKSEKSEKSENQKKLRTFEKIRENQKYQKIRINQKNQKIRKSETSENQFGSEKIRKAALLRNLSGKIRKSALLRLEHNGKCDFQELQALARFFVFSLGCRQPTPK